MFWGILNIGIINAYILWTLCQRPLPANRRIYSLKTFKLSLIHNLTCNTVAARITMRTPPPTQALVATSKVSKDIVAGHPLVRFRGRKRVCHMCSKMGRKTPSGRHVETIFGCMKCKTYLCKSGVCFLQFHAKLNAASHEH